jgi:hypothetical protein
MQQSQSSGQPAYYLTPLLTISKIDLLTPFFFFIVWQKVVLMSSWAKSDPVDFETLSNTSTIRGQRHRYAGANLFSAIYRLDEVEAEDAVCDRNMTRASTP